MTPPRPANCKRAVLPPRLAAAAYHTWRANRKLLLFYEYVCIL
jgi:hypothetical protein